MSKPTTPSGDRVAAPLNGVLVLDLTRVLAGPYAAMVLADLGADVIKIERPGGGDDARSFGPFREGASGYFASVNRGKMSCALDLKDERGRRALRVIAQRADVLIENFRPGVTDRLGIGWEALRTDNPRLVYASCSGFGRTGPYADRPAYDVIVQGEGGLLSVTGSEGGDPVRVGVSLGDLAGALFAVVGILAALRERDRTGSGSLVDVSMLDSVVALLENAVVRTDVEGTPPGPLGTRHPSITPFQAFPTRDGHVVVAAGNDRLWERLCRATGTEHLLDDARFATNEGRTRHHGALESALGKAFSVAGTSTWLATLQQAGVPCGPLNRVDQVMEDAQVRFRDMIVQVSDARGRAFNVSGSPIKLSAAAVSPRAWVPLLGEHTEQVLTQYAGMDHAEVDELLQAGVAETAGHSADPRLPAPTDSTGSGPPS